MMSRPLLPPEPALQEVVSEPRQNDDGPSTLPPDYLSDITSEQLKLPPLKYSEGLKRKADRNQASNDSEVTSGDFELKDRNQ